MLLVLPCFRASLLLCFPPSLCFRASALPCSCASVLPCFCASIPPFFTVLLCFCASVTPFFHGSVLPCYCATVLSCFSASVLPYFLTSMLWCFHASVFYALVLWCLGALALVLPCQFCVFCSHLPPPPSPSQSPPKISVIFCLGNTKYLCCGKNQSKPNACIIAYAWCVDDADALGWGILICARAQGRR